MLYFKHFVFYIDARQLLKVQHKQLIYGVIKCMADTAALHEPHIMSPNNHLDCIAGGFRCAGVLHQLFRAGFLIICPLRVSHM